MSGRLHGGQSSRNQHTLIKVKNGRPYKFKTIPDRLNVGQTVGSSTDELTRAKIIKFNIKAICRHHSSIGAEKYGAVSLEVADSMAKGAQIHFPDCVSVAVTGIAGPEGGTNDKPVGTVCIACAYKTHIKARKFLFSGNRDSVRQQTLDQSIQMLLSMELLS